MARQRYIEKNTGEIWTISSYSSGKDGKKYTLIRYDDYGKVNTDREEIKVDEKELSEKFDFKPWPKPIIKTPLIEPRFPIQIILHCPECGSILKPVGGAICTHPLQYEHECPNPECKYEVCTRSYYSGMYVAVTKTQEEKINNGTYDEDKDGELIRIKKEDLWDFKK